jgi:multidrug efflux pump subunit AcrA (membrane-fusion protein)
MAADASLETQNRGYGQVSSRGGWLKYALLALIAGGLAVTAGVLILGAISEKAIVTSLTHTIQRGELLVTITEQGMLESSENTEIICKVRGQNTVNWVIESGTEVKAGDELIRLDTLYIEEQINERSKYAYWSRAGAESWKAQMARRTLAIPEYLEGRYVAELMTLEKDLVMAESRLRTAQNMLGHSEMMAERGYVSGLKIEQREFWVVQCKLNVEGKETDIDVLKRFTRAEELARLKGELNVAKAQFGANNERAFADASRRDRAIEELAYCVVTAEKDGMVIHPSAARWKNAPEITEGGTVHKDQVLLLMPDLSKMQVKVGIHESAIDRIKPGMPARITLPGRVLEGEVVEVASIAQPAGWWTGNVVKYDTIVRLPSIEKLKPGMSAEVEVIMARHENVLKIPVGAVIETETESLCWVQTAEGTTRRSLELGDSNDIFIVVKKGLREGEQVVLNPVAFLKEAQQEAIKTPGDTDTGPTRLESPDSNRTWEQEQAGSDKPADDAKPRKPTKPKAKPKPQ